MVNAVHPMVFKRKEGWHHQFQRSPKSGPMMWMGLPLEKQTGTIWYFASVVLQRLDPALPEWFATLMEQKLNYELNVRQE